MIIVHRPALPVTQLQLYFTYPPLEQIPRESAALYTLAQRQLQRGTQTKTREALLDAYADLGVELNLVRRAFAHSIQAPSLTRVLPELLSLIAEAITEPRHCPDELTQSKRIYQAELASRYEHDSALAWTWLMRRVYRDHPLWGSYAVTEAEIEAVEMRHVREVWASLFDPRRLLPCLTTDLTSERAIAEMLKFTSRLTSKLTSKLTSDLASDLISVASVNDQEAAKQPGARRVWSEGITQLGEAPRGHVPPLKPVSSRTLTLVHKAKRNQATLWIAIPTISPNHPDHLALTLALCALGGTFSSPLMQEVRVKRGLSYGAHIGLRGEGEARMIVVSATPEAERAAETLEVILEVLKRGASGELTDAEIKFAQSYLINAHPFNIETPVMKGAAVARSLLQGLDPALALDAPRYLAPLTPDEVRAALTRHLTLDRLECLALTDLSLATDLRGLAEGSTPRFDQLLELNASDPPERALEI